MKLDHSAAISAVGYHRNGEDVEYRSGHGVGQIFLEENYLGDRTERTVVVWSYGQEFKIAEIPAGKCNYIDYLTPGETHCDTCGDYHESDNIPLSCQTGDGE